MEVQYMTHIPAVGDAWAFQGKKNKNHIKDWFFPPLSYFSYYRAFTLCKGWKEKSLPGQKLLTLLCSQSQKRCSPLTSNVILSRTHSSFLGWVGSGSETCRWAHGFSHPSRPVSHSPGTEGQSVSHPCLPCCPLAGLLNLTPYGSI